jgi:S1-C subfamily serine protease
MFGLMRRFVRQSLLLVGALIMLAVAAPRAWADSTSDANYAVQVDSPAVVRIVSVVDAQLICHGCLDGVDLVSPQTGAFQFFTSGSGVFISPDGYILTADHVVDHSINNPEDASLIANAAVSDIAQRFGVSQSTVMQFLQQHIDSIEIPMQVQSQQVFLSTAYTGQLQNTAQVTSYQVVRIVVNSPVNKQDVAIIKVEAQDMPYLQLATTSSVNVGDAVTAIAYPADADAVLNGGDFTSLLNPTQSDINTINSLLTASVNNGAVTAQKNLSDGTPIYETSGISAQGSSGGPVIDQQGQIIGFVDAGPPTDRLTFIIPSSVVVDYVRQAGIANPGSATFMSLWTKSMTAYYATGSCHWTHAFQDLTKLHNQYPQFGGIEPFLQNAQAKATPAECPAPAKPLAINLHSGLVLGMLSGSGVLLLALIGSLFLLITRRRKRAAQVSVSVPGGPAPTAPAVPGGTPSFPPTGNGPISMPHLTVPLTPPANGSQPGSASPVPTGAAFPPPTMPVFTPIGPAISNPTANAPISNGGSAGMGTSAMPPVSQPAVNPATPGRRCLLGHTVSDETARFCPQCGTPVSSTPVQV